MRRLNAVNHRGERGGTRSRRSSGPGWDEGTCPRCGRQRSSCSRNSDRVHLLRDVVTHCTCPAQSRATPAPESLERIRTATLTATAFDAALAGAFTSALTTATESHNTSAAEAAPTIRPNSAFVAASAVRTAPAPAFASAVCVGTGLRSDLGSHSPCASSSGVDSALPVDNPTLTTPFQSGTTGREMRAVWSLCNSNSVAGSRPNPCPCLTSLRPSCLICLTLAIHPYSVILSSQAEQRSTNEP